VSENLRYGRPYQEDENFSLENILQDHIERSWPEELLQFVRANNADSDREAWRLINKHKVEHCHEPIIAKVLQEAAALGKKEIVRQLLFDGVHPDIRIKKGDKTALEKTVSEKVQRLLYEGGAKTEKPPSSLPWTLWQSIDCKPFDAKNPPNDGPIRSCVGNEEFRALVVDIYSPISFDANKPTPEQLGRPKEESEKKETKEAKKDEGSKEPSAPNIVNYEYQRYAHPTVDALIREGPDKIMGTRPEEFPPKEFQRYRWIHLPMNHVSCASRPSLTNFS
jgi:hypothetical protein